MFAMFRTDRVVSDLMQGGANASGGISQGVSMLATRLVR